MVRFKKLAAVLLSAVILVCCFTVQASATSIFDKAIKISATEAVSHTFKNDTEVLYKIVLPDSATIIFYCSDYSKSQGAGYQWYPKLYLLDTNGTNIIKDSYNNLFEMSDKPYHIQKKEPTI